MMKRFLVGPIACALGLSCLLSMILLFACVTRASAQPQVIDPKLVTLAFDIDQSFGNGVVVQNDQLGLTRIIRALRPLRARYNVCVIVNPMIADRKKLDAVLDTLTAWRVPFMFDVYTSDGMTLGSCSSQNAPYDIRHGVTISLDDLSEYKKRYGQWFVGLRAMEVLAQDFCVRAVKTTNPEWALPCWKMPEDDFWQPKVAEGIVKFASENGMFVEWSDWHWFEFASWDAPQKQHETELESIVRKYPGVVTVAYANNEPNEDSAKRLGHWDKCLLRLQKTGAVSLGLNDQSWLRANELTCPAADIIDWAQSALDKSCRLIQFEPAWYFFKLSRGTFDVHDYVSDPAWADRGKATADFTKLSDALLR